MTEPQAVEAIDRMRKMFPTWAAWVLNRHDNPAQVFCDYEQSIKPLPHGDVMAGLDRMKAAQSLPGEFKGYVNLLKIEADGLRFNRQSEKVAAEALAMDADRQRNRDKAIEGTSRWASIRNEQINKQGPQMFPDQPAEMARWQQSERDAVWDECQRYQKGATNGG